MTAAKFIHDEECNDGDTETCGRWRSPAHVRHIEFYRQKAQAILVTAEPLITAAGHEYIRQRLLAATDADPRAGVVHLCRAMLEGRTCAGKTWADLIAGDRP